MVPKVIVDARMIGPVGHGIARYVQLLAEGLRLLHQNQPLPYELEFLVAPGFKVEGFGCVEVQASFLSPREWFEIPRVLSQRKAALYHSPSFSSLPFVPCPYVVTVHDLNHLQYSGWFKRQYYQILLRRFVRQAKAVMTISEFSLREIVEWMKPNAIQPRLVLNPIQKPKISAKLQSAVLAKWNLTSQGYWICLAGWKEHKNLAMLLRAYALARESNASLPPLVVAATGPVDGMYPGVLFVGGASDDEIQALMSQAAVLYSPSHYEGFGRPPLEALALGVPVVVSDIAPHREAIQAVWADKAGPSGNVFFANPAQIQDWVKAIQEASKLKRVEESIQTKILAEFDSKRCATALDRIYRDVLGL